MKLRRARTLRQLSLTDAARATKIRVGQLADLEKDDYSNFANLAYARGFLVSYGKYLHLDTRPYMDAFADASTFGMDDYQYLSEKPIAEYRAPTRPWRRHKRNNLRQLAVVAACFVALGVGVFSFYLYVNFKRLGNLTQIVDRHQTSAREESLRGKGDAVEAAAADPTLVPVSSSPAPSASIAPRPDTVPSRPEDSRTAAATLAVTAPHDVQGALLAPELAPKPQKVVNTSRQ